MLSRRDFLIHSAALAAAGTLAPLAMADTLDDVRKRGKIRVALDPNVPPWSYKNDKLEWAGCEYEIARQLVKDLGVAMEIIPTNGANRVPLLITNKADLVVAAMTITPERAKVIGFSHPYDGTTNTVAGPKALQVKSLNDLVGKKVAVARGTISDTDLTATAPAGVEIVRFEDESTTMTSILSGQIDLVAQSSTLTDKINERQPARQMETKVVLRTSLHGMGMRRGDDALKAWVDKWIATNTANGFINAAYKRAHGTDLPPALVKAIAAA
ncbi:transporter substrate-binding domain-containing protein [Herbaspirillum sp. 1130]|uniref:transporter substrate-binding domain-containing protein n=1 Tax=Herbaspirillum sp. 1130 TaxID=2806562 RepID=UPI001AE6A4EB|nr:transporter substrate-binding domain-containing protein [Herbaspirillum sp. 1130]MBP1318280.1 polar amino acid transport system substrate-binding protein [Herbaspirillum sp. 1130]